VVYYKSLNNDSPLAIIRLVFSPYKVKFSNIQDSVASPNWPDGHVRPARPRFFKYSLFVCVFFFGLVISDQIWGPNKSDLIVVEAEKHIPSCPCNNVASWCPVRFVRTLIFFLALVASEGLDARLIIVVHVYMQVMLVAGASEGNAAAASSPESVTDKVANESKNESYYLLHYLLPCLAELNKEQQAEKEVEANIKGTVVHIYISVSVLHQLILINL